MNEPARAEFDHYAHDYTELHRSSIRASGEEPSYFSRYKAQYMARVLGQRVAQSQLAVLDFGCGIGNSIPHLREAFPHAALSGVDPSAESIQRAAQTHSGNATFRSSEGDSIPCPDASFDAAQVACVFHHIEPGQRQHWMGELRRVLKPGGCVFVFEHNVLNPLTRNAVHDCPFDEHAILLPRHELVSLARAAGFPAVRARYIVFFPAPLAGLRALEPGLGWIPLGAQYVVCATA